MYKELLELKTLLQAIPVKGESVLVLAEAMIRVEQLIQKQKEQANETTIPKQCE